MTKTKLIEKIAGRLSGIAVDDLTTAERQIAQLLIEEKHLKIVDETLIDKRHPIFGTPSKKPGKTTKKQNKPTTDDNSLAGWSNIILGPAK